MHIADGAMGELVHQLLEGRFRWQNWLVARDALRRFLDESEPVLLGGRLGLYRAGVRGATDEASPAQIAGALKCMSKWWESFMRAEHLSAVTIPVNIGGAVLGLSTEATAREIAMMKSEWIGSFDTSRIGEELLAAVQEELPLGGDALEQLESVMEYIGGTLDTTAQPQLWPPASLRLDAMNRVYVLLQLSSMRLRDPYAAEKHQNDSFDHDLLPLPGLPSGHLHPRPRHCKKDEASSMLASSLDH